MAAIVLERIIGRAKDLAYDFKSALINRVYISLDLLMNEYKYIARTSGACWMPHC